MLGERVGPLLRRHGLGPKAEREPEPTEPGWPDGSLPAAAPQVPVDQEQLSLL
jgi:hypothetical protein